MPVKKKQKQRVCVIGLGYVGLPLAVQSARHGFSVFGLDNDPLKIQKINAGHSPIQDDFLEKYFPKVKIAATSDPAVIRQCDVVLVCVPTPVDKKFYPDLGPVKKAVTAIAQNLKKGQLVVIESTINPGVCEEVVEPIFRAHGHVAGRDYSLAHCPERINPGDPQWTVANIPRVVGALDTKGLKLALQFYRTIIEAAITPMHSIREAEAVKIVENSFRDINIAFVNELAKSFDRMNIDTTDVIRGAATKPFAFMPHWPSCGVGGHCIPVDPYYLIERAKANGFDHEFLKIARKINNSMPRYTVKLLRDALNTLRLPLNGTTVGVLGISYKANVADLRESPSLKIIELLEKEGATVLTFDPHIPTHSSERTLRALLKKASTLIVAADHREFIALRPQSLQKDGVRIIIDGKNCLDKKACQKCGIIYKGVGR